MLLETMLLLINILRSQEYLFLHHVYWLPLVQLTAMNIIMIVIFRLLANLWLLANLFMKGAFPEMSKFQK